MAKKVTVFYDREGQTLTVWWGDPETEDHVDHEYDDLLIMRNKAGEAIGIEKLSVVLAEPEIAVLADPSLAAAAARQD